MKVVLWALVDAGGRIYCTAGTREILEGIRESTTIDSNAKVVELVGHTEDET